MSDPTKPGEASPGPWRWIGEDDNWRLVDEQTADILVAVASLRGEEVGIRVDDAEARALIADAWQLPQLRADLAEAVALLQAVARPCAKTPDGGAWPCGDCWGCRHAAFLSRLSTESVKR